MSNTLQQSTLLYTEREIKGSYWAALLCSLHATSHTLNVFSKAFYSTLRRKQRDHIAEVQCLIYFSPILFTQKEKQRDHIAEVQCLIYFSPILFTQKGKQRDHIAEGTASFDPPLTSLVPSSRKSSLWCLDHGQETKHFLFQHIARIWHLRHTDTQISFRILNNST